MKNRIFCSCFWIMIVCVIISFAVIPFNMTYAACAPDSPVLGVDGKCHPCDTKVFVEVSDTYKNICP